MQGIYKLNLEELASLCFTLLSMSYAWNQHGNHPISYDFMQVVQNIVIARSLKDRQPRDEESSEHHESMSLIHTHRVLRLLDEAYLMWDVLDAREKERLSVEYRNRSIFARDVRKVPEIHFMLFGREDTKMPGVVTRWDNLLVTCRFATGSNGMRVPSPARYTELVAEGIAQWHEMSYENKRNMIAMFTVNPLICSTIHGVPAISELVVEFQAALFNSLPLERKNAALLEYFVSESARTKIHRIPGMLELYRTHYERVEDRWSARFWDGLWDA